MYAVIFIIMF